MPRKPREFHIGGVYHIVQRGVEKRKIFLKEQDYSRFILALEFFNSKNLIDLWQILARGGTVPPQQLRERLEEARKQKKKERIVELMAFALMPNHFHLVAREIVVGGISLFMRKMGGYSTYFNMQYDRVGSLFQSRYKTVEVQDDAQLGNVFVYVHTNPVELKEPGWKDFEVKDPSGALRWLEEYRWSSYRDYLGKPVFPQATQREFFFDFYGGTGGCRETVEEWVRVKARKSQLGPEILE